MSDNEGKSGLSWFAQPGVGQALTILAGICFYGVFMILPLVGPAAMLGSGSPGATRAPHAMANVVWFMVALLTTLAVAAAALFSKLQRRRADGSPLPKFSLALVGLGLFMVIGTLAGWFAL